LIRACKPCTNLNSVEEHELPENLFNIVKSFQLVKDPTQRYKQLLFYAQKLKGFPEVFKSYLRKSFLEGLFFLKEQKIDQNKVPGCTSQVWILSEFKDGKFYFLADSDSQLTKGLAGLLVEGLRGSSKEEILNVPPEFIEKLGLKQTLTPSRTNGFLNMLKLVKQRVSEQSSENSKNT
jgi:sulfur transfer protein SufE